ncbi:hypothetical protein H8959_008161 [Pygathrix nigripes]
MKTDFKAQLARCQKLLDGGARGQNACSEIYIHGLGLAINRAINIALQLQAGSFGSLQVAANTSTVELVDELEPETDTREPLTRIRNNSAIHIRVFRVTPNSPVVGVFGKTPEPAVAVDATSIAPCGGSHYIYLEADKFSQAGQSARLVSRPFCAPGDICVEFAYHMYGLGEGTMLELLLGSPAGSPPIPLWKRVGSQRPYWQNTSVTIPSGHQQPMQLIFKAIWGSNMAFVVAMGFILINPGTCPELPPISPVSSTGPSETTGFTENPTVSIEKPTVTTEKPTIPLEKPTIPTEEPSLPPGKPTVPAEEPTTTTEETTISTEEPAIPTEKPTVPTEKPTVPTEKPTVPTEKPTVPTEKPTVPTEKPTVPTEETTTSIEETTISTEKPTIPTEKPTISTEKPTIPTEKPTISTEKPTISTEKPTIPTEKPTIPAEKPTIPTEKPTISTEKPTIPTEKPTISTEKPTIPTEKPTIPTEKPTISTEKPTISTEKPTIPTEKPTIPTEKPTISTEKPTIPTEKPTIPTEKPTIPAEKPTIPTEKPTISTEKPTIPTEKPTIPTEKPTISTEKPTISTEKPTIPTEKPTIPTEKPTISTEKPTISTEKPPISTEKPPISTEKPTISTEKPTISTEKPTIPTEKPIIPTEKPTISTEKLTISTEKLTIPTEKPTIPTEKLTALRPPHPSPTATGLAALVMSPHAPSAPMTSVILDTTTPPRPNTERCPPNAHYESCACPASCKSPRPSCGPLCRGGCVCNLGFLFSDNHCIQASSCNCFYNNNYYEVSPSGCCGPMREIDGRTPGFQLHLLPSPNCTERCRCWPGSRVECQISQCGTHTVCQLKNGQYGCHPYGECPSPCCPCLPACWSGRDARMPIPRLSRGTGACHQAAGGPACGVQPEGATEAASPVLSPSQQALPPAWSTEILTMSPLMGGTLASWAGALTSWPNPVATQQPLNGARHVAAAGSSDRGSRGLLLCGSGLPYWTLGPVSLWRSSLPAALGSGHCS